MANRASTRRTNPLEKFTPDIRAFQTALTTVDQIEFESGNGSLVFEDVGIPLQGCARLDDMMREALKEIRGFRDERDALVALSDFAGRVYCATRLLR